MWQSTFDNIDLYRESLEQHSEILDDLPVVLWSKSIDHSYIYANKKLINESKLNDRNQVVDRYDENLPWGQYHEAYKLVIDQLLKEKTSLSFLGPLVDADGHALTIHNTVSTITSSANEIIGVKGASLVMHQFQATNRLLELTRQNLVHYKIEIIGYQYVDYYQHGDLVLTPKESLCLYYTLQHKTAKEIASLICRSRRTIEIHLENIKRKLNCRYKSEVIEKAITFGWLGVIPKIATHYDMKIT